MRFIALVFLSLFLFAACSKTDKAGHYEKGIDFLKKGNVNGAIIALKNALEIDPNYFEARYKLASAYIQQGKYESAEKELIKVLRLNPSFIDARLSLARVYVAGNKAEEALKEVNQYLQVYRDNAEAYEIMGVAYAIKPDFQNAKIFLNKSLLKAPNRTSAKLALAKVYIAEKNSAEAQRLIEEILKADSKNIPTLYLFADIKRRDGKIDEAIEKYRKIAEINPKEFNALLQTGLLYVNKQAFEEAGKTAERLIKLYPQRPEGHYLRGVVSFRKNKTDEAIVSLQTALSKTPILGAHYYLGLCHLQKGNLEQATSEFQRVADIAPKLIQGRLLLSITHLRRGRFDDAIKEAYRALEIDSKNALAHNLLGSAYASVGKIEASMMELDKAIELNPKLVDAHIKKGAVSLLSGRPKEAEDEFIDAVKVSPDLLSSRIVLARYYMKQKKFNEAIAALQKGIKQAPSDAVLYNIIGIAYTGNKDIDSAKKYFEKAIALNQKFISPHFNLAALYLSSGAQDKAVSEYKRVLDIDQKNVQAMIALAGLMEKMKNEKEALAYYNKAKEQKVPAAYMASAGYYMRKKDSKTAIKILDEALSVNPKDVNYISMKGRIYVADKNYKAALSEYKNLAMVSPEAGLSGMVNVYLIMKDFDNAIKELKVFFARDEKRIDILTEIAGLYIRKNDLTQAEHTANRIISLKPKSLLGYHSLAMVYIARLNFDKAVEVLKNSEKIDPKNIQTKIMLGRIYLSMPNLQKAMETFKDVEKLNPRYAPAYFFQGNVHEMTGNKKTSAEYYKKAVTLSPDYVEALNNLAYLYSEGYGPIEEALNMTQRAIRLSPGNGNITDTFGWVLYKMGKYDDALKSFIETTHYIPGNPTVRYHLALAYIKKGMKNKAEAELNNAIRLGNVSKFPEFGDAQKTLEALRQR